MTIEQLISAAQDVSRRFPQADLVKNQVGNLAIYVDDNYVGFIDLLDGEVDLFDAHE